MTGVTEKKDGKMTKKTEIYQRKNSCPAKSSPFSDAALITDMGKVIW